MSKLNVVDDVTFDQEVLKNNQPVLVDFSATWCQPCKQLTPILEKMADENKEIKFVKVDVDDCPDTSAKFKIRSVPTMILFKNGVAIKTIVGLVSVKEIKTFLE